jgi:hypothetical protein
MSITIIQEPLEVTPAYNPINYVVSSDNTAEPSFQYVFDLYIGGTFVSRHRLPPKTFTGVARLDVSSIVQSYVTHDINIEDTAFDRNPNSWIDFYIRFGEEYTVDGVLTTYINLIDSTTCYAVNASLEYLPFADWNNNTYYQGSTRKFLTSIAEPRVLDNTNLWLHLYHEIPENIIEVNVQTFSSNGLAINTNSFSPTDLSNAEVGDRFLRVSVGTAQLKELFGASFFDGASYYRILILDLTSSFVFEQKTIHIQESNCKYENIPLHFLNVQGGFDVFNFKLASTKSTGIEKKRYNVIEGSFNSSNEYVYASSDRSNQVMSSSNQDSITVNSDWITEAESAWLKELVTSPIVFMEQAGQLIPVSITETKYKTNKTVNEKLFNLQITFDFGNENYRQSY